jgi:glutathione-regulated potassium-efflux system ancillary protein KefF
MPPPAPTPDLTPDKARAVAGAAQRVYVLAAHPDWRDSRVNSRLLAAAQAVPGMDVNDLYGSYPDYAIDVPAEQARLAAAQLVVLVHPVQWYSMPALLKLWLDEVLTWGWAYGAGGTALRGKDLWLVATTGGPNRPTTRRATTATSLTPSCRPTSRRPLAAPRSAA